jgi:hypothetical protein
MSVFLDWYIRNVEDTDEGTAFLVVFTPRPATHHTATRNGTEWRCSCSNGVWDSGTDIGNVCEHIQRAYLYYRSMLLRASELRAKARVMAKESKRINEITEQMAEGTATPFSDKRNIKLED